MVTNGRVAWLIKCGFGLEPGFISFSYKPQQITVTETVSSSALVVLLESYGTNWTSSSSWPNQTTRLARLGSWTPTQTAFSELELHLPLNCSLTPGLLHTILLNPLLLFLKLSLTVLFSQLLLNLPGVWPTVSLHGAQRDYILSLLEMWL
jgi:hypothetical protein